MVPQDLKYTREHEWARINGGTVTVGITEHAQDQLGDIVFVDLPAVGKDFARNEEVVAIESTKAAASVYAPVDGAISEVNDALADQPELVNSDCYAGGWMVKLTVADAGQLDDLMDAPAYEAYLAEQDT